MKDSLKHAMLFFPNDSYNGEVVYIGDGKGYVVWTDLVTAQML